MALFLFACGETKQVEVVKVKVVSHQLETKNLPIYGQYIAITRALLDVEVRARVNGYIEQQHFVEGSFVAKDQLLYTLDAGPYRAELASAEASVASAKSSLAKAERDIARTEPLFEQDAASQLDLDNAFNSRESARSSLKSAEAAFQGAQLNVEYTKIKAPIAGITGDSSIDIGALAGSSGTSLLTSVQQVDSLYVEFQMSTLDYLQSRRRLKSYYEKLKADVAGTSIEGLVTISLPDGTEYPHPGQVKYSEPRINSETGTFTVRAEVPNPDRELLPGQYTRLSIQLDQLPDVLVLPEQAVRFEQSGTFVYVIMPDKTIERRLVVLGRNVDGLFVVTSGLGKKELIVLEGTHKVRHGSVVDDTPAEKVAPITPESKVKENISKAPVSQS
jgi:membrane fusion protein (multidrug efflux system)